MKQKVKNRCKKMKYIPFLFPSLFGVIIFYIIPYIDVFRRSFLDATCKSFVGFVNYKEVIYNKSFQLATLNTIKFLIICIPILVSLSFVIAFALLNNRDEVIFLKKVFLFPFILPVTSVVVTLRLVLGGNGLLNQMLEVFGLNGQNWLMSKYSFMVLVGIYIWRNLGYDIILWIASLSTIPDDLYEAAQVDGADWLQCFFYITMPLLKSSLCLITIISIINGFKSFREAFTIAGDYPEKHIYLIQHVFNNWFRDLDINKIASGTIIVGSVISFFIILFQFVVKKEENCEL